MRIMTVLGARPQFIKAAAFSRQIKSNPNFTEVLVHTGQHFDANMSDVFFKEMSIPEPNYRLETGGLNHGAMTGKMLMELEPLVLKEKPDVMMVYGDTNSTLAGALVAAKLHIPVAHVEAGLRSFNRHMPEEINRILTDHVSDWLFCPTETAVQNLKRDGVDSNKIHQVGDIMFDAALFYKEHLMPSPETQNFCDKHSDFVLCTIHRAENTDDPQKLQSIFSALQEISQNKKVLLPLHPRTRNKLKDHNISSDNIHIVEPLPYGDILYLLSKASLVMTDSGGMQKEAYFFSQPCITLREQTEWVETLEGGANQLVGSSKEKIVTAYKNAASNKVSFKEHLYGDGQTAQKILNILKQQNQ